MFKINKETKEIKITRGDYAVIDVSALNADGSKYVFKAGDIVRFKVFKKKDPSTVILQKDIKVITDTEIASIELNKDDTTIGDLIVKPISYWYEVELNPDTKPQTIIGYEENHEKLFTLLVEGGDSND